MLDKLVQNLITRFHSEVANTGPGDNIELEIRFGKVSRQVFEAVYSALIGSEDFSSPRLECSVNVISENIYEDNSHRKEGKAQTYIRRMIYQNGLKTDEEYIQKTRLMRPVYINDYMNYSVSISRETTSKQQFSASADAIIRFRVRAAFDYVVDELKWRFDLTMIKQGTISELGPNLGNIRAQLFKPTLSAENITREIQAEMLTSYEIEIEFIGKELFVEDMQITKKLFSLINPTYLREIKYESIIEEIAKRLDVHARNLKELGNMPISLSKATYAEIYPPHLYYLTEKADGIRCMARIFGAQLQLITRELTIIDLETEHKETIVDCEQLPDGRLLVFDCIAFEGEFIASLTFTERLNYLDRAAALIAAFTPAAAKVYVRLDESTLQEQFALVWQRKYEYKIDGLILTEPDANYHKTNNYKWKPSDQLTIDFRAVRCPQKLLGIRPYVARDGHVLYLLFVGINRRMHDKFGFPFVSGYKGMWPDFIGAQYYPIQFCPSYNPHAYLFYYSGEESLDRQIVELGRADDDWVFHRVRSDKSASEFGNDFRVAEIIYSCYIDVFGFEDLYSPAAAYFKKIASPMYHAANRFKRFVITQCIHKYFTGASWVVDEAAGRGADLQRYVDAGVRNTLFIDIDTAGISELINRKYALIKRNEQKLAKWLTEPVTKLFESALTITGGNRASAMQIHTLVADLSRPYTVTMDYILNYNLLPGEANGTICNFAFHYFCDTVEGIRNQMTLNARLLSVGAHFIITLLDGEKLFDLLREYRHGQTWKREEDGVVKYAFTKKYTGEKFTGTGQRVAVLLPFSDEMYEEPLANIKLICREAKRVHLEPVAVQSFDTFLPAFELADHVLFGRLSEIDREYIALHSLLIFRKKKNL